MTINRESVAKRDTHEHNTTTYTGEHYFMDSKHKNRFVGTILKSYGIGKRKHRYQDIRLKELREDIQKIKHAKSELETTISKVRNEEITGKDEPSLDTDTLATVRLALYKNLKVMEELVSIREEEYEQELMTLPPVLRKQYEK